MRLLHELGVQSFELGCGKLVHFSAEYFLLGRNSMKFCFLFWTISTKLTDYVFLNDCYILCKIGWLYHIAVIGTIRCKLNFNMTSFAFFFTISNKFTDWFHLDKSDRQLKVWTFSAKFVFCPKSNCSENFKTASNEHVNSLYYIKFYSQRFPLSYNKWRKIRLLLWEVFAIIISYFSPGRARQKLNLRFPLSYKK